MMLYHTQKAQKDYKGRKNPATLGIPAANPYACLHHQP